MTIETDEWEQERHAAGQSFSRKEPWDIRHENADYETGLVKCVVQETAGLIGKLLEKPC